MILDLPPTLETTLQETASRRGISKERLAYEYIHHMATTPPAKSYANGDFNFDLARIEEAVKGPFITVPHFDTDEEFLHWINNLSEKDFTEQV